jgi:transketolase
MAHKLRIHAVEMTDKSNTGHPTSCSSMAEALAVIFFDSAGMKFLPKDPRNPANDKFILSKGHAAPIYYAAWAEAGNFPKSDLLTLRQITSDYEGHPTPRISFCDVATGSLGQVNKYSKH